MANENTFMNIPLIKSDLIYGGPVLIILGLILSIWVSDYFWMALLEVSGYRYQFCGIFPFHDSLKNTHYVLVLVSCICLYLGFKNSDRKMVRLWYNLKILECLSVVVGILMFVCSFSWYWFYVLAGVIILVCGWYIITCVKCALNQMPLETPDMQDRTGQDTENKITEIHSEKPPNYSEVVRDSSVNEINAVVINS